MGITLTQAILLLQLSIFKLTFLLSYQLYTRDSSKNWKLVSSDGSNRLITKEPSANVVLLDYMSSGKWQDVVDFDDHLDDISK